MTVDNHPRSGAVTTTPEGRVGLDVVHARSVAACGLDGETGEVFERRLTPDHREILEWIGGPPEPVAAVAVAQPARRLPGARVAGLPAQRRRSLGHALAPPIRALSSGVPA